MDCVTISSDKYKPCIFPFVRKGKERNACVKQGSRHWCATELKSNGEYKKFGHCSDSCPKEEWSIKHSNSFGFVFVLSQASVNLIALSIFSSFLIKHCVDFTKIWIRTQVMLYFLDLWIVITCISVIIYLEFFPFFLKMNRYYFHITNFTICLFECQTFYFISKKWYSSK